MKNNKNELYKTKQFKNNAGNSSFLTIPLDPVVYRKYDINFLDLAIYEFMRFRTQLNSNNRYESPKTEIQVFFNLARGTVYNSIDRLVKAGLLTEELNEKSGKTAYKIAVSSGIDHIHDRIEKKTARENFKIHQENERILKQVKRENVFRPARQPQGLTSASGIKTTYNKNMPEIVETGPHFANERHYSEEEYNAMFTSLEDLKV